MTFAVSAFAQPLVAVVVVDPEAREQGYAVELEALVIDDVLPIDVREGERVRIVDPDGGRHELDVAPGEAWEIVGPRGEAWMSRLGDEVRTDVIEVKGERAAVERLAEALGATLRYDGDRALLLRDEVLFDAPWVDAADAAVDEVRLVRVDAPPTSRPAPTVPPTVAVVAAPNAPRAVATTPQPTPFVDATPSPEPPRTEPPRAVPDRAEPDRAEPDRAEPDRAEPPRAEPAPDRWAALDSAPYVGLFLCGDGTPLLLSAGGAFSIPDANGTWVVSAPGMIHLLVDGVDTGRAAIEVDRHHCRAVW